MRKIPINSWTEKVNNHGNIEEKTFNLTNLLIMLLNSREPNKMPRGIDKHRYFNRLVKAFDKAENTGTLALEEADYSELKKLVEEDIPAAWGLVESTNKAIEEFLNAKQE